MVKFEQEKPEKYKPLTITLETPEEFITFWNMINDCGEHEYFQYGDKYGQSYESFNETRDKMFHEFKKVVPITPQLSSTKNSIIYI